jgi:hypothetical protein
LDLKLHVVTGSVSDGGKFLVLEDGTVIAGPSSQHQVVWASYCLKNSINYHTTKPNLVGAGQFDREGVVNSWTSFSYSFATPQEIQGEIQEFIKNNIAQILAGQ